MDKSLISTEEIKYAAQRLKGLINHTPTVSSSYLNQALGHQLYFKLELNQKVGAFKARGALNCLLSLKEQGKLPQEVTAYSSGNHAQAVAWAAKVMGIKAKIFLPPDASKIKIQAAINYGAEVVICNSREEAEKYAYDVQLSQSYFIHPSSNDMVIAGAGTACFEALQDCPTIDAIFTSCGGGGLISGSLLASQMLAPSSKVYGVEPEIGNDAARSVKEGKIFRFEKSPATIADGVRTLGVTDKIFQYLQKLDGIYEASENEIIYWTQWLTHLLKVTCEPTSALAMAGAAQWLSNQKSPQSVLVILSGGNIDQQAYLKIYQQDMLALPLTSNPKLTKE